MRSLLVPVATTMVVGLLVVACASAGSPAAIPTSPPSAPPASPSTSLSPTVTPTATASATPGDNAPPTWIETGSMATARYGHTATLLRDGTVLVVGAGEGQTAELYDPTSGRWATTETMVEGRVNHIATLLSDGKVLVAGGSGSLGLPVASAELYDSASGRWTATGPMLETRANHTATLLPDGTVLVVGGAIDPDGEGVLASAEAYDPGAGSWTAIGEASDARSGHAATLLPDGTALVAGGVGRFVSQSDSRALSAERYHPDMPGWTGALMLEARFGHTLTLLPDGNVLVAGGSGGFGGLLASAELFDPGSGFWTATGGTIEAHAGHTATLLADGMVLVVGGYRSDDLLAAAELYDSSIGSWTATANMVTPRHDHTATPLPDGRVLVVGGSDSSGSLLATAELYDPGSGSETLQRDRR